MSIHFSHYNEATQETIEFQMDMKDPTTNEVCEMFQRFLLAMGYVLSENSCVRIVEDDV
jgi:hypothetical protein